MHVYVSASTERSAINLLSDSNVKITDWTYVPWGNSYAREQLLGPLKRRGVAKKQLIGYYTDAELFDLTGSF